MKKTIGLLLISVLLISVFCSAVAFADETTRAEVVYNADAFKALAEYKQIKATDEVSSDFNLNNAWLLDKAHVESVFANINYELKNSDSKSYDVAEGSDAIELRYCSPSANVKEDWKKASLTGKINVSSTGMWRFKYVAVDASGKVLAQTDEIQIYFYDLTAPTAKISTTGTNAQNAGLTVGVSKAVSTGWITTTDKSTVTTTYVINKLVKGEWVKIYDYETKTVTKGYESIVSTSGAITAVKEDVQTDSEGKAVAVYQVVYSTKDAGGFVMEEPVVIGLSVKLPTKEKTNPMETWKIILFVVAGLCLVGIIVLIFIKPQPKKEDEHPASGVNNESENK